MRHAHRTVLAVLTLVTALGLVGVSPAAAYSVPTHRQVVRALLTADNLPDGWHRVSLDDGDGGTDATGCKDATSRGVARSADRSFQYRRQGVILSESVQSYRTLRAARLDVRRLVETYADCDDLVLDGHPWTVRRLPMLTIGDQQALFELQGFVTTPNGDVPMRMWAGVARTGHHVALTLLVAGGAIPDEDARLWRDSGRGALSKAMAKVVRKLGV